MGQRKRKKPNLTKGTTINIEPSIMMKGLTDVGQMVHAHQIILKSCSNLLHMFVANGVPAGEANKAIIELNRRAAQKARETMNQENKQKEFETNGAEDGQKRSGDEEANH